MSPKVLGNILNHRHFKLKLYLVSDMLNTDTYNYRHKKRMCLDPKNLVSTLSLK